MLNFKIVGTSLLMIGLAAVAVMVVVDQVH
jgi:hypothetical protein